MFSKPFSIIGLTILSLAGRSVAQFTTTEGFHCDSTGSDNYTHTLTTSFLASTGKQLKALMTWTPSDTVLTLKHGDDLVYTKRGYGTGEETNLDITFGSKIWTGVNSMSTIYKPSEQTLRGSIDGQAIAPYKKVPNSAIANVPKLADGRVAPTAKQIANITAADFKGLFEKVKSIDKTCGKASNFPLPSRDLLPRDALLRRGDGLDRSYSIGYRPDTNDAGQCITCKLGAEADSAYAIYLCVATSEICAITFGIECAICWGAAVSVCVAQLEGCIRGPLCCPTGCQEKDWLGNGQCCFLGESCLNSDKGLCCKKTERPCGGKACCHGSQVCIGNTPGESACCPQDATCNGGKTCCKSGSQCLNNACCPTEKICGNNCCKDNGPFLPGFCANAATGLCCTGQQVEVNGICCPPGNKNVNGKCVDPRGKCGDRQACTLQNDNCPARQHCGTSGCCEDTIF